nr:MAG TPA: hypothetical protein [Caudoviricetes sp.]
MTDLYLSPLYVTSERKREVERLVAVPLPFPVVPGVFDVR